MTPMTRPAVRTVTLFVALILLAALPSLGVAAPEGQMTFAFHVTLAPRGLDPAETESAISPFLILYGLHDALLKPMPGSAAPFEDLRLKK